MITYRWPIFCLLFVVYCVVFADPKCRASKTNVNSIICSPGDNDYALERGLVSDNNQTTKVTLRGCRITVLGFEAFHGLPSLKQIDLSNNILSELRLGTLDAGRQVTHLNLSFNLITDIPLGLFDKNPYLLSLDLKGNKLDNLKQGIFDPLSRLKYLSLSSNAFLGSLLNPSILSRNRRITDMDFSRNDMSKTDENLLQSFQTVQFLNLDRCMLTEVPNFATRANLNTMKKLLLSVNEISAIENPTTFANLENLELLNIGWNVLKNIHEDVFKPLRSLKIILLRNNKLRRIPETLFQNMAALNNIDVSNNLITFIPVNAFRGTTLKNLNLASNQFTYLTDNFCLELKNSGARLQKFYFNQNPWQCKCLLDILKEVEKFDIEYNSVKYDGAHAVCVSEEFDCKRHSNFNEYYIDLYVTVFSFAAAPYRPFDKGGSGPGVSPIARAVLKGSTAPWCKNPLLSGLD